MAREVSRSFVHPVLSWLAKQFPFRGAEEPEENLRVIRLLDEICERGKSLNEVELLGILGISKKRLHQLWKQGNAIRPGYTVKHQEGYWLVQHDQSEPYAGVTKTTGLQQPLPESGHLPSWVQPEGFPQHETSPCPTHVAPCPRI